MSAAVEDSSGGADLFLYEVAGVLNATLSSETKAPRDPPDSAF